MSDYQPRFDLPKALNEGIAKIIVRYAHLEHLARTIIYQLLSIDSKRGRLVIREPDLAERIEMIAELCHVLKLSIDDDKLDDFKERCQTRKTYRDLLAHGLWAVNGNGEWIVQMTRGNYPKVPFQSRHERKKKIRPAGVSISETDLHWAADDLERMIEELNSLCGAIHLVLPTSPKKSKPPPQTRWSPRQKPKRHPSQRKSSQE
jgi:hypothetical protein